MSEGQNQPVSSSVNPPDGVTILSKVVGGNSSPPLASMDETHLIDLLRGGNEAAFVSLIERYHASMLRVAKLYVSANAVAEEVVQEAWLGVFRGLHQFKEKSSLKTWIFRILTNCAKTRALREGRSIPFSSMLDYEIQFNESAVEAHRFIPADDPQGKGSWATPPQRWDTLPEARLLSQETHACIELAVEALPPVQRTVMTLRDIEGWTSDEVCRFLEISEVNQRVLLHRARSKVRRALEQYFRGE
jgi:RNA polymerase sigma-70 factor, ECF subfamily